VVSYDEVVLAVLSAVADSGDGVFQVRAAGLVVQDTRLVVQERLVLGAHGNAGWLLEYLSLQGSGVLSWDSAVAQGVDLALGCVVGALAISTSVFVVTLELLAVGLQELEGVGLKTTVATGVLGVAVNQLLLGKLEQSARLDLVSSLHGSGDGESPA